MRTSTTGAASQAVLLLSEVLQSVSGEAAEDAADVARGVLSGSRRAAPQLSGTARLSLEYLRGRFSLDASIELTRP